MRASQVFLLSVLAAGLSCAGPLSHDAAAAEGCGAALVGLRAEWHALTHGAHVAASQTVVTSDGRRLAGSQLNYMGVVLARAEDACGSGQIEQSAAYVQQAHNLLYPSEAMAGNTSVR
jgi:hypothetical protein